MREAIRIGIIGHIEPRHMQSQLQQILYGVGEKSVFVQGAREVDVEQMEKSLEKNEIIRQFQFNRMVLLYVYYIIICIDWH